MRQMTLPAFRISLVVQLQLRKYFLYSFVVGTTVTYLPVGLAHKISSVGFLAGLGCVTVGWAFFRYM